MNVCQNSSNKESSLYASSPPPSYSLTDSAKQQNIKDVHSISLLNRKILFPDINWRKLLRLVDRSIYKKINSVAILTLVNQNNK